MGCIRELQSRDGSEMITMVVQITTPLPEDTNKLQTHKQTHEPTQF
jgi:hypothetical protein